MRVFSDGTTWSRRSLLCVAAVSVSLATAATACGDGGDDATTAANGHSISPSVSAATVTISPADDTDHARPDHPIVVRAAGGKLTSVKVSSKDGHDVTGTYNAAKTVWKSKWTLSPDAHYRVKATAANSADRPTTQASSFETLKPKAAGFHAYVTGPVSNGSTVGVGFPVVVNFSQSIANKAWVERALQVKMSKPVEGAWNWLSDTQVVFRPKHLWPEHEKIHLIAHLDGVRGAKDMYGYKNLSIHYKVGHRVIVKASAKTHQLKVYKDGKLVNHWPVSMGRGGVYKYYTTSGIHLTMDEGNPVWMTSPGIKKGQPGYYHEQIYYAVRISNSGEYIHSMPSTVWAQGHTNVSHGCINSPPAKAKWFYSFEHPGDVVIVTGTPRKLEYNNGWGFWQASWHDWVKGSALHKPVKPSESPSPSTTGTPPTSGTPSTSGTTPSTSVTGSPSAS